jgi:transcriptional regulator with XRE-family HTH domain
MSLDSKVIGRRVNQLRELQGRSLGVLSEEATVSKSYLAKLEKGEVDNPGLNTLHRVASALGVTLADLLASEEPEGRAEPESPTKSYEELLNNLPKSLRKFLDAQEASGDRLPADTIRALASLKFRGRQPRRAEDWQFVYDALRRSLR